MGVCLSFFREIGSDTSKGDRVFKAEKTFPGIVAFKSLLASVGAADGGAPHIDATVCIISTGDELTCPGEILAPGKIYDSNTTMLSALLEQHGFNNITTIRVNDTSVKLLFCILIYQIVFETVSYSYFSVFYLNFTQIRGNASCFRRTNGDMPIFNMLRERINGR